MDKFNYLKEHLTAALATWQQTNGGKITVGWMHAANPEVIAALLAELEAKDKRIAELDYIRSSLSQVLVEFGDELGCNPDNESIMMAIDELKATQVTGPLALIIKRAGEMERILEGVTPEMIAGGWTAKGISDYAKSLEAKLSEMTTFRDNAVKKNERRWEELLELRAKLATPVRLPTTSGRLGVAYTRVIPEVIEAIRAAGFNVEGDE